MIPRPIPSLRALTRWLSSRADTIRTLHVGPVSLSGAEPIGILPGVLLKALALHANADGLDRVFQLGIPRVRALLVSAERTGLIQPTAGLGYRVRDDALAGSFVLVRAADGSVSGFLIGESGVAPDSAFVLRGEVAEAAFPELSVEPTAADCEAAWTEWAASRQVPPDLPGPSLDLDGLDLRAGVLPAVEQWLRMNQPDVFAEPNWLPLGQHELRRVARLVIDSKPGAS